MILYNVTINIDDSVHDEWLRWMQEVHIPEVMATGYFLRNQLFKLLTEVDNGGTTYSVQYFCRGMVDLEDYQREEAPALQAKTQALFEGKFYAFRTVLEVVEPLEKRD